MRGIHLCTCARDGDTSRWQRHLAWICDFHVQEEKCKGDVGCLASVPYCYMGHRGIHIG